LTDEGEKMPRGRPKLTEEQKLRNKQERETAKIELKEKEFVGKTVSDDEIIAEMTRKMDEAQKKAAQQVRVPEIKTKQVGGHEEIYVAKPKELVIEDEARNTKPEFIQNDEKGWSEIPLP
jgi:hypothetical protein